MLFKDKNKDKSIRLQYFACIDFTINGNNTVITKSMSGYYAIDAMDLNNDATVDWYIKVVKGVLAQNYYGGLLDFSGSYSNYIYEVIDETYNIDKNKAAINKSNIDFIEIKNVDVMLIDIDGEVIYNKR